MLRRDADGLVTYHFESLTGEGVVEAVFTRLGGISRAPFATLNVGHSVGDDEAAVDANHARIHSHMGLDASQVVSPRQIHSNRVVVVTQADAGRVVPEADGLVTGVPGLALLLRFADCQPILLYDRVNHALGLIHAGWRGVVQGIAYRAVEAMREAFGTRPQDVSAGLGPAIGPCCYTVGDNVAAAMGYALPDWSRVMRLEADTWHLDLPGANGQQLSAAGVRVVEQASLCTACHNDEFYSHRAERGKTGRFAVVAFLTARQTGQGGTSVMAHPGEAEAEGVDEFDSLHPPGFPAFQEPPAGIQ